MHNVHKRLIEERKSFAIQNSCRDEDHSIPSRVQRMKDLQIHNDKKLFAVMYTTLHKAAMDGDVEGISYFLHRKLNHIEDYDNKGFAAIHYAAEKGYKQVIDLLLKKKCDVDLPSLDGSTPAMFAAKSNHSDIISQLHYHNSNILSQNRSGFTIAHIAAYGNHVQSLKTLVELFSEDKKYIHETLTIVDEQILGPLQMLSLDGSRMMSESDGHKRFLKQSVKQNTYHTMSLTDIMAMSDNYILSIPSRNGMTPLHMAATSESKDAVEFLLQAGVDPNVLDGNGETALHKVGRSNSYEIYRLLVRHGADEQIKNTTGETPIALLKDDGYP